VSKLSLKSLKVIDASTEFLEQKKMVKFPPPLYVWAWEDLSDSERQITLKELQEINKGHVYRALEARTGPGLSTSNKIPKRDEPREWRAWSKMLLWEKKEAYESLRVGSSL
jgi:hypothetical protein